MQPAQEALKKTKNKIKSWSQQKGVIAPTCGCGCQQRHSLQRRKRLFILFATLQAVADGEAFCDKVSLLDKRQAGLLRTLC